MVWYKTINLPDWTPSNSLIVLMWTIVFVLISLSILLIWNKYSSVKDFSLIIWMFILNAVLIVGWNILFFSQQQIGLAFLGAVLLISNILILIFLIWRFSPLTACLLLPYSLWVAYSLILTFRVWMIN
jgi:tryptophan-rich sensory protein